MGDLKDQIQENAMEAIRAKQDSEVDVGDVYSPPRMVTEAVAMGLRKGFSLDLTAKRPGEGAWDFSQISCQREAVALINETRPFCVIGSPPCTPWSTLQNMSSGTAAGRRGLLKARSEGDST